MMPDEQTNECPAERLGHAMAAAQVDNGQGLDAVDELLGLYGGDARLHFLRGSLLAGLKRYEEAQTAMRTSIEIAPAFAIARYQLGLLQLTSGDATAAETTWAPLQELPSDNYMRLFASGLCHLARDDFAGAIALLKEGISRNQENPMMNSDMQMMITEAQKKLDEQGAAPEPEFTSAAQLLLQQSGKGTKH